MIKLGSLFRRLLLITNDPDSCNNRASHKYAKNPLRRWQDRHRRAMYGSTDKSDANRIVTGASVTNGYGKFGDLRPCSTETESLYYGPIMLATPEELKPISSSFPTPSETDAATHLAEPRPLPKKVYTFPFSEIGRIVIEKRMLHTLQGPDVVADGKVRGQAAKSRSNDDSNRFVRVWEINLLPELEKTLDGNIKGEYSINVRRGEQDGYRIIEIMIPEEATDEFRALLEESKDRHLQGDLGLKTIVQIKTGKVAFLADDVPTRRSTQSEDIWDPPINTRRYTNPVMGDSVGPQCAGGGSATMGPLLQISQRFYRILNWHIFDDKSVNRRWDQHDPPSLDACHPSLDDSSGQSSPIGKTIAYSGRMHKTTRVSRSIQNALSAALGDNVEPVETVTDWVLVETDTGHQINRVRKTIISSQERCNSFSENIIGIADPEFGSNCLVYSTGRSSGYSIGQMCEVPGEYKFRDGLKTRNWSVECTHVPDEVWNRGGMGIPGDSGAPVINKDTNELLGQIWGRNEYKVSDPQRPPLTFFTAMTDIYDDIKERMPGCGAPRLPTDSSLSVEVSGSTGSSPHIASGNNRREALASISEGGDADADEQPAAQATCAGTRRSAARIMARLPGYEGKLGLEPIRRWALVAHAATF